MSLKIAIQGIESSFHDLAVRKLFPNEKIQLIMCDTFDKVSLAISQGRAEFGVLAIENTIAGSILPNYNIINANGLSIYDEVFLNIQMHIMALEGQSIYDIEEVHSHPIALLQCKEYLRKLPPGLKIIEGKDTASEAKRIKEENLTGVAAIAGKQVAQKFGLTILGGNIQSIKENQTRFVLIGNKEIPTVADANKATIKFELAHEQGSLANTLQLFTTFNINLTKIQSLPIINKPWQYAFFIDVSFQDYEMFKQVTKMLKSVVIDMQILGVYRQNYNNVPSELLNALVDEK